MTVPTSKLAVAQAFQQEWGQLVATLIRLTGDWDLAEDAAQDAFGAAVEHWARDGVPERPGAWLMTVARRRAIDRLRREAVGISKVREAALATSNAGLDGTADPASEHQVEDGAAVPDDMLRLIFTCCHPALSLEARVALTLRTLAGLSTAEIARALLVGEPTMAKRLVRAKQKMRHAGIPYRVPSATQLPQRLPGVLAVLYLLFNEGYSATTGADLMRPDLAGPAIRLARTLVQLLPHHSEAIGLLALMLLHDARAVSRVDADGNLVPLDRQDRSRWNLAQIDEAVAYLNRPATGQNAGPYRLQAAIAACHATAGDAASTDWAEIADLYGELERATGSAVVRLNRAVAVAMVDGPAAGLRIVDQMVAGGELTRYHLLPATRADLLRRLGDTDQAVVCYRQALELTDNAAERAFLRGRISELVPH